MNQELAGELRAFMASISSQESGGRYHVRGPQTKYGRPLGKYQILDSNWDAWAREAGIPGAQWTDPAAQERVAAAKFLQYYKMYGGRWDAVAVAWFAGPGRAKTYLRDPQAVMNLADVLGTNVATYVQKAMGGMRRQLGRDPLQSVYAPVETGVGAEAQLTPKERLDGAMTAFRKMVGGGDNAEAPFVTNTPGVGAEATAEDMQPLPFDALDVEGIINPEKEEAEVQRHKPEVDREAIV